MKRTFDYAELGGVGRHSLGRVGPGLGAGARQAEVIIGIEPNLDIYPDLGAWLVHRWTQAGSGVHGWPSGEYIDEMYSSETLEEAEALARGLEQEVLS
jgi:hypothetical protein